MAEREVFWNPDDINHRIAFATAIAPLVILWKRKEDMMPKAEARIYMNTLKHVSSAILVAAVERTLELETWFPEPAKLLAHAADIVDERRDASWKKWIGADQDCEECHRTRWVTVDVDGVERLKRCGCWERAMAEMAAIGQPLKRKELPPANPNVEMV